jgi:hypothetical protein
MDAESSSVLQQPFTSDVMKRSEGCKQYSAKNEQRHRYREVLANGIDTVGDRHSSADIDDRTDPLLKRTL